MARAKFKADVKIVATTNKPSDVDGHRPPRKDPDSAPHKRAALENSKCNPKTPICIWGKRYRPVGCTPYRTLRLQAHKLSKTTICNWKRYLARDPPSYDSGNPLSEIDAKTMMDKIEARSKWLKANGKARKLGKHQRAIQQRKHASEDSLTPPPQGVFLPAIDSAIIPAALVSSPYPSEVGHRPPCDDPDRVREGCEKGTIAGDDPKAFGDKYRFTLHGETETNLRNIWAAMQREAYKTCPVSARRTRQLKTTFQQYRDANTNWKDILLAYRADKIKEWNQDSSSRDWVQPRLGSECCLADSLLGSTEAATTDAYRSNSTHGATHSSADQGPLQW